MRDTKDVGFGAYLLSKGYKLNKFENGSFYFEVSDIDFHSAKIDYVNSGFDRFHGNIKFLLSYKSDYFKNNNNNK